MTRETTLTTIAAHTTKTTSTTTACGRSASSLVSAIWVGPGCTSPTSETTYEALKPLIGGTLNSKVIRAPWGEILRLSTSIKQGTATDSLMPRKLGSYARQNGLAAAVREPGRIRRTLFILDWLQSVELRRRVNAGLNKGEAPNALARAAFFNRLTAAIVPWNSVYLERATGKFRSVRPGSRAPDISDAMYRIPW